MRGLTRITPPGSNFEHHQNVVKDKREPCKGVLTGKESIIASRFEEFERCVEASTMEEITADVQLTAVKAELHSCFNGKTKSLKYIFTKIADCQTKGFLKWCPYCGLTKPNSYDHYLPKESFPEFSVMPLNLIECCTTCNSSKKDKWLKVDGKRFFLHLYSDDIPEEKFLFADITARDSAFCATYKIIQPSECHDDVWRGILSHFTELGLLKLFAENTNDEVIDIRNICVPYLKAAGPDLNSFIRFRVQEQEEIFGVNHWRNVLLKSLAENNQFLAFLHAEAMEDDLEEN
jgi:hypothetical protein